MTTPRAIHPPDPGPPPGHVALAPGVTAPDAALRFSFVSASGPGGQNVNKRATKAELRVDLHALGLRPAVLDRLRAMAGHRVTAAGELLLEADEHRSQRANRDACLERLGELIRHALVEPKVRKKTRPTAGSRARRLDAKKRRSRSKDNRRGGDWD